MRICPGPSSSSERWAFGSPPTSGSSRTRSRRSWPSGGSTRPRRSSLPSRRPAGTSTGPGPSPREPGAGRSCLRRGAISPVRRPRPMRPVREHDRLPLPFELGRTLLVRGTVERRAKRKREARDTLTKALEVFDGLGAALWADRTRAELARIGGRAPSSLDLTPTEDRVAALVAGGQHQPGGGRRAVHQHPHGGGQPQTDLPQAGRSLAHGAGLEVPIRHVRTLSGVCCSR